MSWKYQYFEITRQIDMKELSVVNNEENKAMVQQSHPYSCHPALGNKCHIAQYIIRTSEKFLVLYLRSIPCFLKSITG